ncbi:thiamine pyrophosphate-dependent dehydrogenase E1 component subunit alpha [candidate division KSB1 bacterium]
MAEKTAKKRPASKKKVPAQDDALDLTNEQLLDLYYYMMLTRATEDRIFTLYRQGKIVGGVYSGFGMEAISVGSAFALEDDDMVFPLHRDMGAHLVRGQTLKRVFCQFLGRANGPTQGKDSNMHMGYPEKRIFGQISHLGSMIPVAAGAAYAEKLRGKNVCAMTYIGEGGSNVGDFHEGINMASVIGAGLVVIIENNQYAYSTPTDYEYHASHLVKRADGYGIPGILIEDGNDVLAVYRAARQAVLYARSGNGTTLIEAITMRIKGHSAHDDHKYVPDEKIQEWMKKDPIERFEKYLKTKKLLNDRKKEEIQEQIAAEIDEAVEYAEASPLPVGPEAGEGVFAE